MNELTPIMEARIRRLTPINQLPSRYQDKVILQGDVLNFPRGSRVFFEGSEDEYVHYLLEGRVAMLVNGAAARYVSANSDRSAYPLDEAGKERTCSALVEEPAKVFRIAHSALERQRDLAGTASAPNADLVPDITAVDRPYVQTPSPEAPAMPEQVDEVRPEVVTIKRIDAGGTGLAERDAAPITAPSITDVKEFKPAAPEFYSDTQYGQGLAALVKEIRSDNEQFANQSIADPKDTTLSGTELSFDQGFFDVGFGQVQGAPAAADSFGAAEPAAHDWISNAFKKLESTFRDEMQSALAEEHARAEQTIQVRVAQVQKQAEQVLREKLSEARARDQERTQEVEARLRERYNRLEQVVNKITHQKAEIQRARRELE